MGKQPKLNCGHFNITKGCKECNKLFKLWNKKLEDETDHVEIENFDIPTNPLKEWDNLKFRKMNQEVLESKRAYFESCSRLLLSYKWDNPIHKEIWKLHSEGFSTYEIEEILKKKKFKRTSVRLIVNHYKKELA